MTAPKILVTSKLNSDYFRSEECDCSAPTGRTIKHDSPVLVNTRLVRPQITRQTIDANYELALNPVGRRGLAVLDRNAIRLLDSFSDSRAVECDDPILVLTELAQINLLQIVPDLLTCSTELVDDTLISWLHLTDRCNLRCSYCYLPHVREDMSVETGHAAVDAIFRSAKINGFKQVKIKYAGGEPLLRYPLILDLHTYAKSLADVNGLALEEVVLSNGTLLTEEMAQNFKSLGIRLMISLDGFGNYHDSHRPYASGRGSFNDVAEAIDLALANGLAPTISVTVSSRTAEGLPEIVRWILDRDLPFSLNFYRENTLSASHADMRLDEEKIVGGMLAAFKVIERDLPKRSLLGSIMDRANLSSAHTHTCGVGQNYIVFAQNGQVAKCQMQIRQPVTDVRVEDPLAVIRADRVGIRNISVEEKEGCKTCEWKYWCTGGCPLETYRVTGRYDVKSPNCNIYKALFPEALHLEGLRLLKYADDPEVVMKI